MARSRKPPSTKVRWLAEPEDANFPACLSYLSLVFAPKHASRLVKQLRKAKLEKFKAKDIFRASGLSLLGVSNSHVERDLAKIREGKSLAPLLLARMPELGKVIVADGYHRLCAVYTLDEDAVIPCKVA